MSINNSYFSRNNTIISNSFVNTGRNPVFELFYGDSGIAIPLGFSRFIFDLDLTLLKEKINDGTISLDCNREVKHVLKVTNTVKFNKEEYLNTSNSQGRKRATSFDLILFRIPYVNFDSQLPQLFFAFCFFQFDVVFYYLFQIHKNQPLGLLTE